jgi:aldose 1-epimerase
MWTLGAMIGGSAAAEGSAVAPSSSLNVEKTEFGKTADGQTVDVYTLKNPNGLKARIMTYGATLLGVEAPDRDGKFANVTLYLDTFDEYYRGHPLFGSIVGRYANRIEGASFKIDGREYTLAKNDGPNHIHGGRSGFQKMMWQARPASNADGAAVELSLVSPDGQEGYPGTLNVKVTYRLTADNALRMEYEATTDKPTHVNLTNHVYWNLGGAGSGDALGHLLMINADRYLVAGERKIPTGEMRDVKGTPMDFTTAQPVGSRIAQVEGGGYDHCYVLNKKPGESLVLCARVTDPKSGRTMEMFTTEPGVQLYTANGLSDRTRTKDFAYGNHHAVCLEAQHYPDSPNKPQFPTTLLTPGETYRQVTMHKFGVVK